MNINISDNFRQSSRKTIGNITLFISTYLILIILAGFLTIFCIYIGFKLIEIKVTWIILLFGLSLMIFGLTVFYFLIKFIFSKSENTYLKTVEITAKEEPDLFALIYEIADEVKTSYPKKVILTHEINAAVYYDSSFWSMFFPIKKNLNIGLGLVNTLTKQNLKV